MRTALFQFATNTIGKIPALIENMLYLYLINAMERAAALQVVDLTTPTRDGEIMSLTGTLEEKEVREAGARAGADLSIWGGIRFVPDGQPVINGMEIEMMSALKDMASEARGSRFNMKAMRGDLRTGVVDIDMAALEALVEEMLGDIAEAIGLEGSAIRPDGIGEGLSRSDRAVGYFVYALRIVEKTDTKLRFYQKALETDPGFAIAYTNAAQLLLGEGRHGEAMKLLLRAEAHLKGSPMEPDILNLLGVATMHMGMWDGAVRVWERACEISPSHVETLCNLASAFAMRGMHEEAERYYRRAISEKDDFPLAWFALGRLQAREEKYEEAEESMRRYIELCPGDPWAYYILGSALLNLGRDDQAEFALAKASQLDPDGEAGTLARRELQELKE